MAQGDRLITMFDNEVEAQVEVLQADRVLGDSEVGELVNDFQVQELDVAKNSITNSQTAFDYEVQTFNTLNGPGFNFKNDVTEYDKFPYLEKNEYTQTKPTDFVSLINSVVSGNNTLDSVLQIIVNGGTDLYAEIDALEGQLVTLTSDIDSLLVGSDTDNNSFKKLVELVEAAQGGTFAQWMIDNTKRIDGLSNKIQDIDSKTCYKDELNGKFYKIVMSNGKLILIETLPAGTIVLTVISHISNDLLDYRSDLYGNEHHIRSTEDVYMLKSQIKVNDKYIFINELALLRAYKGYYYSTKKDSEETISDQSKLYDGGSNILREIKVFSTIAPHNNELSLRASEDYFFSTKDIVLTDKYLLTHASADLNNFGELCGFLLDDLEAGVVGRTQDVNCSQEMGNHMVFNESLKRLYVSDYMANSYAGKVNVYDVSDYTTSEEDVEGDIITTPHIRFNLIQTLSQNILNAREGSSIAISKITNNVYILSDDTLNGQLKIYNVNGNLIQSKTLKKNINVYSRIYIEYNPNTKSEVIILVTGTNMTIYDFNFNILMTLQNFTDIKYAGLCNKGFVFNINGSGISIVNYDHLLVLDNYPVLNTNLKFRDLVVFNDTIIGNHTKLLDIPDDITMEKYLINQYDNPIDLDVITNTKLGDLKTY